MLPDVEWAFGSWGGQAGADLVPQTPGNSISPRSTGIDLRAFSPAALRSIACALDNVFGAAR